MIPNRPMGFWELARRSVEIYFHSFLTLVGLAILVSLIPILLIAGGFAVLEAGSEGAGVTLIIMGALAVFVAFFYFYAAATLLVSLQLEGQSAGLVQLLRHLPSRMVLDLLGTNALAGVIILAGCLLIVPGFILMVRYVFSSQAVVSERLAYREAIRRSAELVKGSWWRVFGSLVLLEVCMYAIAVILGAAAALASASAMVLVGGLAFDVMFPVFYIFLVLLYHDLKVRQEAQPPAANAVTA